MDKVQGKILIIDDSDLNGMLLTNQLKVQGYLAEWAPSGREGLSMLAEISFDLILLDIMMPEMNGFEVLETLKDTPDYQDIPVLMISALTDLDSVIKCINLGATDYLPKPFNNTILKRRVEAALESKRRKDQEKAYLTELEIERAKADKLLLNILPRPIAERLKRGERTIADNFEEATVLFADLVNFSRIAAMISPINLVKVLNVIFSRFDQLAKKHGVEKIKTIGDGYMVVCGVPTRHPNHAIAVAEMAIDMMQVMQEFRDPTGNPLLLRIGISSGPVVAGIIGRSKFTYDLWGQTVNMAKRMEEHGAEGKIHISASTQQHLNGRFVLEARGEQEIKGLGPQETFFLIGRAE